MLLHDCITHHSKYNSNKIAIVYGEQTWSYEDLEKKINQCANLLTSMDVRPGDRVGIMTKNSPWYLVLLFASAKVGAVFMPLNFRLSGNEILELIQDAEAKVVFVQAEFLASLCWPESFPGTCRLVSLTEDREFHHPLLTDVISDLPDTHNSTNVNEDDPVLLQYTSGTTGKPKGVLTTHAAWVDSCLIQAPIKRLNNKSVLLCVLPMCHTGGTKSALEALFSGATLIVTGDFDAEESLSLIDRYGVTNAFFVPTMLYRIIDAYKQRSKEITSLGYINIGGATINKERLLEAVHIFNCQFTKGYGMTEIAGGSVTAARPEDHIENGNISDKIHSVGKPLIDCDVKLVDDDGREVAQGEPGELIVRTPRVMSAYISSAGDEAVVDQNGYYHTGDIARQDADGFFYIVDRKKDMVISGGLNIYSKEVESTLEFHPKVKSAFVVGLPDDHWGEVVHGFVVLNDDAECTQQALIEWCKAELASYKAPRQLTFLKEEALPLSVSGKVVKKQLRDAYLSGDLK